MITGRFDQSEFVAWEKSADAIDFKRVYAEMAGGALPGLILSQTMYWHLPAKDGRIRLRVQKNGLLWLVKAFPAWWDECCATEDEARGAIKKLAKVLKLKHGVLAGTERPPLIEVGKWKFGSSGNAAPTTHIRIIWENFLPLFEIVIQALKEQSRSGKFPDGTGEFTDGIGEIPRSLTETTTETTPEITFKREEAQILENSEFDAFLREAKIPESVIRETRGALSLPHARAALYLTIANSNGNRVGYLSKVLRNWASYPAEAAKGLEDLRHVWYCSECGAISRRKLACPECYSRRDEVGEWIVSREETRDDQ